MADATKKFPAPTWDLESIFPGGSKSKEFKAFRDKVKAALADARDRFDSLPRVLDASTAAKWKEAILLLQSVTQDVYLVMSFSQCLTSQDVGDGAAHAIEAEGDLYYSEVEKLKTELEALSLQQPDDEWEKLVSSDGLKPIRFSLNELRYVAGKKMPAELESLALDLGVNGYHAWNRLYDKMAGDQTVEFSRNGESSTLSLGQLAAKMSDPDRRVRQQAFDKMTQAWQSRADLAAMTLNALAGFRLSLYERRQWDSPLFEPLLTCRLRQESLDAMWAVIARETQKLGPYVEAKKKLLGIDKYRWYDQFSPCGKVDRSYTFDEAVGFIVENVRDFSKPMADFFQMAVDKRWIEAENRPGKAAGGYCTGTGPLRQSRIFMTYAGTYENLLTIAHELGHAYHQHVLKDTPFLASLYPMTLAETASIFTEMLVTDAALDSCRDPLEKLMLIDQKLQQPYTFFTDIHCRYLFDHAFLAERRNGVVSKDRLCELMVDAQERAFGSLLDESGYHPLFWASKLHFFLTDQPFYNFPYTFGYLFAGGVYDRTKKEGRAFEEKYRALLRDSGSMTTEEAAARHLGVDLTGEQFWTDAVRRALGDVDTFVELARTAQ
ncbi:MAG TPA: M3 family oligoendopeptidase [Acidobacteriota bacterium]|nr:M3 family oligoendopeptidase [Acidobacteriota bacterium]